MARSKNSRTTVRAAGAVVLRRDTRGDDPAAPVAVALIHRERYDDWTLPKGKLEPGETAPQAAVREVREETGITVRLGVPLDSVHYPLSKSTVKEVDYWVGEVISERPRPADDEVTAVEWVDIDTARRRLTYDHDRDLLEQAVAQPVTLPLVVLRHAKAVSRSDWDGGEATRPLTRFGQRQARLLKPLLSAYDVTTVFSSPWRRCRATVLPYAAASHLDVITPEALTEQSAKDHPDQLIGCLDQLRDEVMAAGQGTVLCGHRPVLPAILEAFGVPGERKVRTSEACVIHLDTAGAVVAAEWHRALAD